MQTAHRVRQDNSGEMSRIGAMIPLGYPVAASACLRRRVVVLCRHFSYHLYDIINVYLPYECTDNHDMYVDYLSKIAVFTAGINSTCIFIVGDFNADLSKTSPVGSILCDFCHDNSFTIADKEYLPVDSYTYVSSAWGTTSWLDHIVCTADAMSCVSKMEIVYSCIHSDHHPVLFCLDCDIVPECNTSDEAGNTSKLKVHWNNLGPDQVYEYTNVLT